ncbi:MAG: class I SAM-dependent methyltransferase [Patescibacteria group bacterium]
MTEENLTARAWADYELLDSGDGMKLERFDSVTLARPETQALWKKNRPELWSDAHATFTFKDKKGSWATHKPVPESWGLTHGPLRFLARLTGFKHTGIFPEQEPNWVWVKEQVRVMKDLRGLSSHVGHPMSNMPSVLNLFGYTGIATLAAANAGAKVTHVDASKQSLDWAHENAKLSGIDEDQIRWILDDALSFVKREARRGAKYDGIILDPPAFGRGAKGEVWKIEEDFTPLLEVLKEIFSDKPGSFFLVNGYAAGYAPRAFAQAVESVFGSVTGEYGELAIKEASSERVVPAGIYVRFVR